MIYRDECWSCMGSEYLCTRFDALNDSYIIVESRRLWYYVQYHTKTLSIDNIATLLPTSICSVCACPCSWLENKGRESRIAHWTPRGNPKGTPPPTSEWCCQQGAYIDQHGCWSFPDLQTNQIWKNDCCYNQYHNNRKHKQNIYTLHKRNFMWS